MTKGNLHEHDNNPLQTLPVTAIHTLLQQFEHILYNVHTGIQQVDTLRYFEV